MKNGKNKPALIAGVAGLALALVAAPILAAQADASLSNGGFMVHTVDGDNFEGWAGMRPEAGTENPGGETEHNPLDVACTPQGLAEEATAVLSWEAVPGIESYRVMLKENLPGASWEPLADTSESSYTIDAGQVQVDHLLGAGGDWERMDGTLFFAVEYSAGGKVIPASQAVSVKWLPWLLPDDVAACGTAPIGGTDPGAELTLAAPRAGSAPACVLWPGALGSDPKVTLNWSVPAEMKGYTVKETEVGMVREGSMQPINRDLLGAVSTTGDPSNYGTTFTAKQLSGSLAGQAWTFGIRFVDQESGKTSAWLTGNAAMGNAGMNATCSVGVVN